jgi:hypothetical protein
MQSRKLLVEGLEERRLMSVAPHSVIGEASVEAEGSLLQDATAKPLVAGATGSPGLNAPIGPQQGVSAPIGAIILAASSGTSANQNILQNSPAGSTFYFTAGTYNDLSINVKPGNTYIGAFGAVLKSSTQQHAFQGDGTSSAYVTISNLTVNGYIPVFQEDAIQGGDYWHIDHIEVLNASTGGVLIGSFSSLTDSYVHDCGQLGIKAYSTDNACSTVLFNNVRVSHNNPNNAYDIQYEAGGSKFWNVNGLTITHCEFDNNFGDGIWTDGNLAGGGNTNVVIDSNWTHGNARYGIFHEIGGSASITNNLTEGNGLMGIPNVPWQGSGIHLDNSESVIIQNNTIRNNYNALSMASYQRSDTTHMLQNITVRNNDVTATQGMWGVYTQGSVAFHNPYTSNITFDQNAYHFGPNAHFNWAGSWNSWTQWRALGFDLNGSFNLPVSTSSIVGRKLFYNQSGTASPSRYDGNNAAINSLDDRAIATDKVAYIPGTGAATFANVSSYTKGINGIMIDIAGTHGTITAADFTFRVGNNNAPNSWAAAPAPSGFSVRAGAGTGGSDRVEITWANGAIAKKWLEVIVKANANTGLSQLSGAAAGIGDVFMWGSAPGDAGPAATGSDDTATNATVGAPDELEVRKHYATALTNVPITSIRDMNRDAIIDGNDELFVRNNNTTVTTVTKYLNVTLASASPEGDIADPVVLALSVAAVPASGSDTSTAQPLDIPQLSGDPSIAQISDHAAHGHSQQHAKRSKSVVESDDVAAILASDDSLLDDVLADLELG